jgi:hypothetical protein
MQNAARSDGAKLSECHVSKGTSSIVSKGTTTAQAKFNWRTDRTKRRPAARTAVIGLWRTAGFLPQAL